jgi:hypothetical protein
MSAKTLLKLLEQDALQRKVVSEDPTAEVSTHLIDKWDENYTAWDFSLPTATPPDHMPTKLHGAAVAWKRLQNLSAHISLPSILNGKFVIAGGAVGRVVQHGSGTSGDLDLFYVGSEADATQDLEQLLLEFQLSVIVSTFSTNFNKLYLAVFEECQKMTTPPDYGGLALWGRKALEVLESYHPGLTLIEMFESAGLITVEGNVITYLVGGDTNFWTQFGASNRQRLKELLQVPFFRVCRNRNAVTFCQTENEWDPDPIGLTYQVILRAYARFEHVVLGFDVGSSAIMFHFVDGKPQLALSLMGFFAYTTGFNVVDIKRLSTTYAHRLGKYMRREFGFILPHFNVDELPVDNVQYGLPQVVDMPGLRFVVDHAILQNLMCVDPESLTRLGRQAGLAHNVTSDYSPEEVDRFIAVSKNILTLLEGGDNYLHFVVDEGGVHDLTQILREGPLLSVPNIANYYDKVARRIWDGNKLGLKHFRTHLQSQLNCIGRIVPLLPTVTLEEFDECANKPDLIRRMLRPRCEAMIQIWQEIEESLRVVPWMTKHPHSQEKNYLFTGSFSPIYTTNAEWYGKYYLDKSTDAMWLYCVEEV